MKVLWLCNTILPKIAKQLNSPVPPIGGWLTGLSDDLQKCDDIELSICFPFCFDTSGRVENLYYFSFARNNSLNTQNRFREIITESSPDIIHIFGTEYRHSLDMIKVCEECCLIDKTVIGIQGMVSVCARHYCAGLSNKVIHAFTLRDLIKFSNIHHQMKAFEKRGNYEIEALKLVKHIIGRTDWDKACTQRVNPNAVYHFCNETLRTSFYNRLWNIEDCEKHSVFVSQCSYPIKGMHYMLEAMAEIVKIYPDAKLYTTGFDPLKLSLKRRIRQDYYSKFLGKLIKKYSLEKNVVFLGTLSEEEMCEQYLKSNVFVSCSSIENSPNSLGEAMILGVPTVSSDVGGVKNMLTHEKEGFVYQADAPYMLAYYIEKLFEDVCLQKEFSQNARSHALHTHNRFENTETVLNIYNDILLN